MTKITGTGTDTIKIESDEFKSLDCVISGVPAGTTTSKTIIGCSDGTVLGAEYEGTPTKRWRFPLLKRGTLYDRTISGFLDDVNDIVWFRTGLSWCLCGNSAECAGFKEE